MTGLRRGCCLMIQSRTVYHYRSCRDDRDVTLQIREIAETRVRYGVQRIHILPRREGWLINHKKTHRIYYQEGMNLRRKRPQRHVTTRHRCSRPEVSKTDRCWIMDFVADNLFNLRDTP
ncbi:integrase core domain protein [Pectobacterium brasiliense ICMP 19477]|nr:integrase core domain protein [Pectobacterium brasiliense ICMP 19477]